jgi:hypothetical protein
MQISCKWGVVKTVERKRKRKKKKVMRMCAISLGKTEGMDYVPLIRISKLMFLECFKKNHFR